MSRISEMWKGQDRPKKKKEEYFFIRHTVNHGTSYSEISFRGGIKLINGIEVGNVWPLEMGGFVS